MRTLGSVYDEVLGLMFSNNTGSSKVTTEDASVAEYMFNMHHAFNSGLDDLYSTVIDLREFVFIKEVVFGKMHNIKEKLEEGQKNRYICATDDVYKCDNGKYKKTILYDYLLKDVIAFEGDGDFAVSVKVKPIVVNENTKTSNELNIEDAILSALVYYMAYRLYLEDDASIATSYLNIYEAKKEDLKETYGKRSGSSGQTFESVRGWY
jgi:hypothetical protein